MITYLLQLTICWGLFYAAYHFFLKGETHFSVNRWYLLGTLGLGLLIPLVDWTDMFLHQRDSLGQIYIAPLNTQMEAWDITVTAVATQSFSWYELLKWVYFAGVLVTGIKLMRSWLSVFIIRQRSVVHQYSDYDLVLTNESHMPFSFLRSVFCSREYYENSPDIDQILAHEEFHIKARHSADVIFIEILKVLLWFHPLVYLYKNALQQIHEYQADYAAYHVSTKKQYGRLLLSHAATGMPVALTNQFYNSQLKNRFKMMTKRPSTRKTMFKYLVVLPLAAMAVLLFSFSSQGNSLLDKITLAQDTIPGQALEIPAPPPPPPAPPTIKKGEEEVFRVVEEMPRFPGCEEVSGAKAQKTCADKKMLEYLYKNIRYPEIARKNGVEGNVVVSFIVEKDGSITEPRAIRTPGAGLGEEAVRVVNMMANMPEKWTPGKQRGRNVRVQFILPVKFEINDNNKPAKVAPPPPPVAKATDGDGEVFRVVEQMPRFPGCEDVAGDSRAKKACADRKMLHFIYENVKYPELARNNEIEGNVVIVFTIETDGSITNPKVVRDPGAGLAEEALRVVELMNEMPEKWTPGVQKGEKVRVQFVLPVKFEIKDNKNQEANETKGHPLLVIDKEIIGTLKSSKDISAQIKTDEIESVSVLKGESAVKEYGEQGRHGVIEITTKWKKQMKAATLNLNDVKIYPVPAQDRLNIEAAVGEPGIYEVEVRDLKGSVIKERTVNVSDGALRTHMELDGLIAGPYFLMVSHNGKLFSKAFIKQ